jgi:malate dehydrogenase
VDIAVIGAGGSVGRDITKIIVFERLLERDEHLVLVGNPEGESGKSLYGFTVDLMEAYAEVCPRIDVVFKPEEIEADLIIMAAGATVPINSKIDNRDFLAEHNFPIFERYASALAKFGHGSEIVICIANPNELSVAVFAKYLGRKRVIGMGAFLDTLRFRKEIAFDLGIRRQRIHAFILGEHGFNMVPIWSGIHIYGFDEVELWAALDKIRRGYKFSDFPVEVARVREKVTTLVSKGNIRDAFDMVDQYPPDIRVAVKPFITHFSGSKTAVGTAEATLELIRAVTSGHDTFITGQLSLEGEFYGIHGTLGVPFIIGNKGVERIVEISLSGEEEKLLKHNADLINQKINKFL